MAKKKSNTKKEFPNQLKLKETAKHLRFLGINGRFGMTSKMFVDFTFDEMVEFYNSHDSKTRNKYFEGVVPPKYVSPFDEEAPIAPNIEEEESEE